MNVDQKRKYQLYYAPSTHWDQVFQKLRQAGTDLDWQEQWVAAFAPILETCQVQLLLDLGCGTGNDVARLARNGYPVIGLDYSREAIRQAATKAVGGTAFVVADMATLLPFADAAFDAIMSNVAMHMFDDARTRALFAEVKRILRPGGVFLFHVNALEDRPLRAKRKPPTQELAANFVLEADGQTMHFFSEPYLRDLLTGWQAVNLKLVEITTPGTQEPFKYVWRGAVFK